MQTNGDFEVLTLNHRDNREQMQEVRALIANPDIKIVDIKRHREQLVIVFRRRSQNN